jgi:C-terminal peptidase prc
MKRLTLFFALLMVACTTPSYPGIDNPTRKPNSLLDRDIIAYIDQRLGQEYYWLDEVEQKSQLFDREYCTWNEYLANSLSRLTTNEDDGYVNGSGKRVFYSYISEYSGGTRSVVSGFGVLLHYTILVDNQGDNHYYFMVDHVYPNSPAEEAGIKRGDMIMRVDGSYINANNYSSLFTSIQGNRKSSVELSIKRQTTQESFSCQLTKAQYDASPVAHRQVIEVEGTKIGYLAYLSFDYLYDEDLLAALSELAAEGAQEFILDLRINRGGSVNSAALLCSALMPQTLEGKTLCTLVRNPRNQVSQQQSTFSLSDTGSIFSLDNLTVICSNYSASASELVVMGLRGLDVPVRLIGSITEGKNCGMDVTRKTISGKSLEFAPITFMCFNAKGDGDWGEGIVPDIDLTKENNGVGVHDANYPMPRADWGDSEHDIALVVAIAEITGKQITTTRSATIEEYSATTTIEAPLGGIRLYQD